MFTLPSIMQSAVQTALPTPLQNALPAMWPTAWATALPTAWPGTVATAFSTVWPAPTALPAGSSAGVGAGVSAALPAELLNVTRNFAEVQLASCNALMQAAFNGGASLFDLNVHATRDGSRQSMRPRTS
jgi:hypothetical protein